MRQVLERFGVPLDADGRRLSVTRTVGGKGSSASVNGCSVKVRKYGGTHTQARASTQHTEGRSAIFPRGSVLLGWVEGELPLRSGMSRGVKGSPSRMKFVGGTGG